MGEDLILPYGLQVCTCGHIRDTHFVGEYGCKAGIREMALCTCRGFELKKEFPNLVIRFHNRSLTSVD